MKKQTVHLQDDLDTSSTTCLVHTVDTDVVVIIIGKFHVLTTNHPAADIWIAFGAGKILCIYTSIQSAMTWEEISQPLFTGMI